MGGYREALDSARRILGSYRALGRVCGISGQAVLKWSMLGYPPRTEYTGETDYASAISRATRGAVKRQALLPEKRLKAA
jgi:DNA-binding transcriptional regulator YdaS (Cro superfamily)